jgi:hypothetical protein
MVSGDLRLSALYLNSFSFFFVIPNTRGHKYGIGEMGFCLLDIVIIISTKNIAINNVEISG